MYRSEKLLLTCFALWAAIVSVWGGIASAVVLFLLRPSIYAYRKSLSVKKEEPNKLSLEPDGLTLWHALLSVPLNINYIFWLLPSAPFYALWVRFFPKKTTATDVVRVLLNSSAALYLRVEEKEDDALRLTFHMEDIMYASSPYRKDRVVHVEAVCRVRDYTPCDCRVNSFSMDGHEITDVREQLTVIWMLLCTSIHTPVHGHFHKVYEHREQLESMGLDALLHHGTYLNAVAHITPSYTLRITPREFRNVLEHSMVQHVPHHAPTLSVLRHYSAFVRDMMAARSLILNLAAKYRLPCDAESLFVSVIVHATDHNWLWEHTRGHHLDQPHMPGMVRTWCNGMNYLFIQSNQFLFTNLLRKKAASHPFFEELYNGLLKINPEIANGVCASMAW